jgi:hypothetical protein
MPIARFLEVNTRVLALVNAEDVGSYLALSNVAEAVLPTAPKPTPTAKPYGKQPASSSLQQG